MTGIQNLMTVPEYARRLGCSESYVRRLRRRGRLVMQGALVLVAESDRRVAETRQRSSNKLSGELAPSSARSGVKSGDPGTGYCQVRAPCFPSLDVLKDPGRSILTLDGRALITYDPNSQAGMIYAFANRIWSVTTPIGFVEFAGLLDDAGYSLPETPETRRWMMATLASPRRRAPS